MAWSSHQHRRLPLQGSAVQIPAIPFSFFRRRHALGLVDGQIRYEAKESFGNKTAKMKVKTALQRRRDGERRRTKRGEFESGTKLRATRKDKKVRLEID